MSGTIGLSAPTGMLAALARDSSNIKDRLDVLTQQSASGRVADTYAGLGGQASVSIDLRPQLQQIEGWKNNIAAAGPRLQITQTALQRLSDIASNFATATLGLATQTSAGVDATAIEAKSALAEVQSLLNTQLNGIYLFAGQYSVTPPLSNAALASFVAQTQAPVASLGAVTGVATAAAIQAAATATPLTATVGTSRTMAQIADGQDVAVGVVAGQNAYAVQSGPATTGSYVKDLVANLAAVAALAGGQTLQGSNFTDLVTALGNGMRGTVVALSTEMAGVGAQQAQMTTTASQLDDQSRALTIQISGVEDVDLAATATALTQVQAQLQASYHLISTLHSLSLVNFLAPGG